MNPEEIKKYTPIVFLDREEKYRPISIEEYLTKASVYVREKTVSGETENRLLKNVADMTSIENPVQNSYLFSREDWNHYNYPVLPRCYSASRVLSDGSKQLEFHYFFPYNKGYLFGIGDHQADWEEVVLHYDSSNNLQFVFFSSHKWKDGYWLKPEECEFIDGRLVIYSARGSHGFYHKEATWIRFLGTANDHTSRGTLIFPEAFPVGDWFNKGMDWSPDGISSPYFMDEEMILHKQSNSFFRRMFCCFYCDGCEKVQDCCLRNN
jgi:hypothetical protein